MAKIIKFRRGTTAELSVQSGVEAELFVDTTKDTLVIMDGLTPGGYPLARESQVTSVSSTLTTNYIAAISSNSSIITTNYTSSVSNLSSVLTVNYTAADSSLSSVLTTNYRAADSSLSSLLTTNYTAADSSISFNVSTLSSNTWRAATTSTLGLVRADGTSIVVTSGVISALGWNVTYTSVTVTENNTFTIPANCIQVNGYVDSRLGLNTGSQAKIDIRNVSNTVLGTIYAGLTSVNDGGGGGNWFIPFSLPIVPTATNILLTRSSGGNAVTMYITSYVQR